MEKHRTKPRVRKKRGWGRQSEKGGVALLLREPAKGIKTFIMSYFSWGGCRVRAKKRE